MRKGNVGRKTMVWRNVCNRLPYTLQFMAMKSKVKQHTNFAEILSDKKIVRDKIVHFS